MVVGTVTADSSTLGSAVETVHRAERRKSAQVLVHSPDLRPLLRDGEAEAADRRPDLGAEGDVGERQALANAEVWVALVELEHPLEGVEGTPYPEDRPAVGLGPAGVVSFLHQPQERLAVAERPQVRVQEPHDLPNPEALECAFAQQLCLRTQLGEVLHDCPTLSEDILHLAVTRQVEGRDTLVRVNRREGAPELLFCGQVDFDQCVVDSEEGKDDAHGLWAPCRFA